jgi:exopolysaccharide biosynthesis polyprenyl glycosylphosphotransferase
MLLAADVLGLSAAFLFTTTVVADAVPLDRVSMGAEFLLFFLTLPVWVLLMKLHGLYDRDEERADNSTADDLVGVFHVVTVGVWVFIVGAWVTGLADPSVPKMAIFWALAIVTVTVSRALSRIVCRRRATYVQNTVIVGAGAVGRLVAAKFTKHPEYGINVLGFVDADPPGVEHAGLTILGAPEHLPQIVKRLRVERIVFAFTADPPGSTLDLIRALQDYDVQIDLVPRLFEVLGTNISLHTVEGIPLHGLPSFRLSRSALLLKRSFDLALSSVALLLLAPAGAGIAAAIRLDSPGPVLFRQTRIGTSGRTFRIYKFRTMYADADARKVQVASLNKHAREGGDSRMFKVPNDPRVTRAGRVLRRFSLDEFPQLINVLKGEMSLVGPRPLPLRDYRLLQDWHRARYAVLPGMTGLWQISGRSGLGFDELVRLDFTYLENWSIWLDISIIVKTIPAVIKRRGAF